MSSASSVSSWNRSMSAFSSLARWWGCSCPSWTFLPFSESNSSPQMGHWYVTSSSEIFNHLTVKPCTYSFLNFCALLRDFMASLICESRSSVSGELSSFSFFSWTMSLGLHWWG